MRRARGRVAVTAALVVATLGACSGGASDDDYGSGTCSDPDGDVGIVEGLTDAEGRPPEPGTLVPDGAIDVRRATVTTGDPGSVVIALRFAGPLEAELATTVEAGGDTRTWRTWVTFGDFTIGADLSGGGAEDEDLQAVGYLSGTLTARRQVTEDEEAVTEVDTTVGDGQSVPLPLGTPFGGSGAREGPLELSVEVEGATVTIRAAEVHRYVRQFPPTRARSAGASSLDDHKIDECEGPIPIES